MKRQLFIILLFAGSMVQVFAQISNDKLRERMYVQTDKKVYLSGEQIRLNLMTVDMEHVPLVLSKVAYAELVDDSIGHIQIIVELTKGIGEGMMQLPADLPSGIYRLISYTQFMRNEGAEIFFETTIGVINPFQRDFIPQFVNPTADNAPLVATEKPSGSISLQTNKTVYATREQGELLIAGLPETIHTLSVSIAGKDLIDLHVGGEAVTTNNQQVALANELTENTAVSGKYLTEFEGHILIGKVLDNQTGQTVSDPTLKTGLAFPGKMIRYFPGHTTETGEIRFYTAGTAGTKNIATIVYDSDEKYRVDVVSPFVSRFSPKTMPALSIDSSCYNQLIARSVAMQASHYFLDNPLEKRVMDESILKIKPVNSYLLDEYTRFTTMREVFTEFISNARFERQNGKWVLSVAINTAVNTAFNSYYGSKSLVLFDGVHISDHEFILNYDPLLIERINIYTKRYNFGGELFEGIVELFSYPGRTQEANFGKSIQVIPYEGPQAFEPLTVPDYSSMENRAGWMPDTRHTLLWKPNVRTEGQSTLHIPFDTSDLKGDYQVTVEGITIDGTVVNTITAFSVD